MNTPFPFSSCLQGVFAFTFAPHNRMAQAGLVIINMERSSLLVYKKDMIHAYVQCVNINWICNGRQIFLGKRKFRLKAEEEQELLCINSFLHKHKHCTDLPSDRVGRGLILSAKKSQSMQSSVLKAGVLLNHAYDLHSFMISPVTSPWLQ